LEDLIHQLDTARLTMKISIVACSALFLVQQCAAFVPSSLSSARQTALFSTESKKKRTGSSATDLDLPCLDECALESFPNLPESIHPGVLSGQAQVDLYKHAKENGK
jgi:hypothetical protein